MSANVKRSTADDLTNRILFIIQGSVLFQKQYSDVPGYKARLSLLSSVQSYVQPLVSHLQRRRQHDVAAQMASGDFISQVLGTGDLFVVGHVAHEKGNGGAPWVCDDGVAIRSSGTCWTIEVDEKESAHSLWPLAMRWIVQSTHVQDKRGQKQRSKGS